MSIDRRYDRVRPGPGTLTLSQEVRTNFQALERGNELRPVLATTLDPLRLLQLYVEDGYYAITSAATSHFTGGFSGDFLPPITVGMERTDILVLNAAGNLVIYPGFEAAIGTSVPSPYPSNCIAIAEVVIQVGATTLADPNYVIIRDVRPFFITSASGFGINPTEEVFTATSGQTVFDLTTFTYTPGEYEINVFVGGVRKNVGDDYSETSNTQIVFVTGLPLGEKVVVWKVGSANRANLADLDDVTVDQAEAVTDPDNNRPTNANRNNPFGTLNDISTAVGTVPFGIEHNSVTGAHGPQVTIAQTNTDIALIVNKANTDSNPTVLVGNSGTGAGISVMQAGDGIAINVLHYGTSAGLVISDMNTASHPALYIDRAVTINREVFIRLEDTASVKAVDISFYNDEITLDDNASDTRRIILNANKGSIALKHNTGSGANLLITKTGVGAAGRSIDITHSGTGEALNIEHLSTSATPAVRINRASTTSIAIQVDGTTVDPLWHGVTSVADTLHTHKFGSKRPIARISAPLLYDLDDISSDQSAAFGGAHSPSSTNPLATIDDINDNAPRTKFATYTGNGGSQSIATGFQPDWVMVYNGDDNLQSGVYVARSGAGRYFSTPGTASITITVTGFDVVGSAGPINQTGKNYFYIAFKGDSLPISA